MIHFEIPKNQSSIIKVIGVGGGGSNAVNYMYSLGLEGVDFIVCNTDSQALALSPVPNKIQLGPHLTAGLGAGANPEIGKQSCEESIDDVSKILKVNTRMVFITAGMGGGTGTGGAPVVAKICRDMGILTVGIVTTPFTYEGRRRMKQAQEGIERMREHVDTVLVISNDKLRQQFGNLPFTKAFAKADDILATAAKCITDVITTTGQINVDFADVCTVMKNGGVAILGSAVASGENRATIAVEQALSSPLLNDSDIRGAKWILLNITSATGEFEHTMDEAEAIQAYVQQEAGEDCDVILGMGHDPALEDRIGVTVIATGFNYKEINVEAASKKPKDEKIRFTLEDKNGAVKAEPTATAIDETNHYDLMPKLVELTPEPVPARPAELFLSSEPEFSNIGEQSTFTFKMEEQKQPEEQPEMKLVMKNEPPVEEKPRIVIGERVLTDEEIAERLQLEEQKRALEERAMRLKRMSFQIGGAENHEDIEHTPAYLRKSIKLEDAAGSGGSHYSPYTVGNNEPQGNNNVINTINTYLQGNKPD